MRFRQFSPSPLATLVVFSLLGMFIMQSSLMLNYDYSWLLLAARRLLSGGMYTQNYFETNPPLILFLYMPPVILSHIFSINFTILAKSYFVCLALFSFALCYPIIEKIFHHNNFKTNTFSFVLLIVFLCLPNAEFGQKEHLINLFCLPYFLAVALQLDGGKLNRMQAMTIGILAGLGFAIKPFYLSAFLLIEIYRLVQSRKISSFLRIETVTMTACILLYGLTIILFFKDYLSVIVPFAARNYYQSTAFTLKRMVFNPMSAYFGIVFISTCLQRKSNTHLLSILLLVFTSFYFIYVSQLFVAYYRMLPLFSATVLIISLLFLQNLEEAALAKLNLVRSIFIATMFLTFLIGWVDSIWVSILIFKMQFYLLFGCIAFFIICYIRLNERRAILKTLLSTAGIVCGGLLASHFIGSTEWSGHRFSFTLVFMCLLFGACIPRCTPAKKDYFAVFSVTILLLAFPLFYFLITYYDQISWGEQRKKIVSFLNHEAESKPVYFFSDDTYFIFPIIDYAKSINASRIPYFWMLPGMLKQESTKKLPVQQDKELLVKMIADDLTKNKPELILIDKKNRYIHRESFSYLDYFLNDPKIQPIWHQYHYLTTLKTMPFYNFDVYRRSS
jgi:hypothetical protein